MRGAVAAAITHWLSTPALVLLRSVRRRVTLVWQRPCGWAAQPVEQCAKAPSGTRAKRLDASRFEHLAARVGLRQLSKN